MSRRRDELARVLAAHDWTFFDGNAWTSTCDCGATVPAGGMELHRADAVLAHLHEQGIDVDGTLTRAREDADARGDN